MTPTRVNFSLLFSVYLPMVDEINTLPLVKKIFDCNKECFIPKYVGDTMEMVRLDSYEEIDRLPLTPWNIRQPAGDESSYPDRVRTKKCFWTISSSQIVK